MDYENMSDDDLRDEVHSEALEQSSRITNEGRDAMVEYLKAAETVDTAPPTIEELEFIIHQTALAKGWWDGQRILAEGADLDLFAVQAVLGTKLLLITSEIAEAFEEYRNGNMHTYWVVAGDKIPENFLRNEWLNDEQLRDLSVRTEVELATRGVHVTITDGDMLRKVIHRHYKPEGILVEMADAVIRALDLAGAWTGAHGGMSMQEVIELKMAYNNTRPHRHGGKLA